MLSLFLALAQIVITGPPATNPPPQPADYIFSGQDYPTDAVRNHWEGTVLVDVLIGTDGSPKSCAIVKSSGHRLLDDTTCNLIMTRAKFAPPKDKSGNPTEEHFQPPKVTWRLAPAPAAVRPMQGAANLVTLFSSNDYPKEAMKNHWEGAAIVDLTVSADGRVSACNVVQSSGYEALDNKTCEIFKTRARFQPAKSSTGRAVETVVRTQPINWKL